MEPTFTDLHCSRCGRQLRPHETARLHVGTATVTHDKCPESDDVLPYPVVVCWGGTKKRTCTTEAQYRAAVAEMDAYVQEFGQMQSYYYDNTNDTLYAAT